LSLLPLTNIPRRAPAAAPDVLPMVVPLAVLLIVEQLDVIIATVNTVTTLIIIFFISL
jgi:hypothetical protein